MFLRHNKLQREYLATFLFILILRHQGTLERDNLGTQKCRFLPLCNGQLGELKNSRYALTLELYRVHNIITQEFFYCQFELTIKDAMACQIILRLGSPNQGTKEKLVTLVERTRRA